MLSHTPPLSAIIQDVVGGGSGGNAGTLSETPPAWVVGGGGGGAVALAVDTSMDAEMAVVESAFEIFGDGQ